MMQRLSSRVILICAIFGMVLFVASVSRCDAARVTPAKLTLATMEVIEIIDSGTVKDLKVTMEGVGEAILKNTRPLSHKVGQSLHYLVVEAAVREYGLPTYIACRIAGAGDFHDGWAKIDWVDEQGYDWYSWINIEGDFLSEEGGETTYITRFYDYGTDFSEGVALIKGKLIDTKGRLAIDKETMDKIGVKRKVDWVDRTMVFKEGMIAVPVENPDGVAEGWTISNKKYSYQLMDKNGKLKPITDKGKTVSDINNMGSFSEGLTWAWTTKGFSYLWVDKNGEVAFSQKSLRNSNSGFHDGLLIVELPAEGYGRTYIAVDKTGKEVLDLRKYEKVHNNFSEGFLGVSEKGNRIRWAFIDKTGKQITNFNFGEVEPFSEGLARVGVGIGSYGFINTNGEIVIKIEFEEARSFSEGLAAVAVYHNIKYYKYIDKTGKVVIDRGPDGHASDEIQGIITDASSFSEGFARVTLFDRSSGGRYAYIDKTGIVRLWFY
jgi:hypothetical protein